MEEYLGVIKMFGGGFAPRGFALCEGQLMSISTYTALFSILGTSYGGDGNQTFALPDLRGRVPVGCGQGPGLTANVLGEWDGVEYLTLDQSQMPAHTHIATFTGTGGGGGGGGAQPTINVTSSLKVSSSPAASASPYQSGANALGVMKDSDTGAGVFGYVADPNPSVDLTGLAVSATATGGSAGGGITGGTVINSVTGSGLPTPIMQPYLVLNFLITIEGLFPARN